MHDEGVKWFRNLGDGGLAQFYKAKRNSDSLIAVLVIVINPGQSAVQEMTKRAGLMKSFKSNESMNLVDIYLY